MMQIDANTAMIAVVRLGWGKVTCVVDALEVMQRLLPVFTRKNYTGQWWDTAHFTILRCPATGLEHANCVDVRVCGGSSASVRHPIGDVTTGRVNKRAN